MSAPSHHRFPPPLCRLARSLRLVLRHKNTRHKAQAPLVKRPPPLRRTACRVAAPPVLAKDRTRRPKAAKATKYHRMAAPPSQPRDASCLVHRAPVPPARGCRHLRTDRPRFEQRQRQRIHLGQLVLSLALRHQGWQRVEGIGKLRASIHGSHHRPQPASSRFRLPDADFEPVVRCVGVALSPFALTAAAPARPRAPGKGPAGVCRGSTATQGLYAAKTRCGSQRCRIASAIAAPSAR